MSGNDSQGLRSNGVNYKKMNILKRDTNKIKTNPKYKCLDDGSEDENDAAKNNINDDPQAMSSKELQFRDNILKYESKFTKFRLSFQLYLNISLEKKKRKERKQKEKEMKKLKALNGDDSTAGGSITAGSADTAVVG